MSRAFLASLVSLSMAVSACGSRNGSASLDPGDRLSSASIAFSTLGDGKDEDSAVAVQLLRSGNELVADVVTTGMEYDDNSTAPPLALAVKGSFTKGDVHAGALRLRLTPDGDDTWTFNARLRLTFADETQETYAWSGVRLDEDDPERTLVLQGARQSD